MSVINWDVHTRKIVNDDGSIRVDFVQLSYDQYDTITFKWKTSETGTIAAKNVSAAVSWSASINIEYNDSATVMARTLNADIDSTDAANGILQIPIDSYTATWLSQLGTSGVKSGKLEVIGRNLSAKGIFKAIVDINCENAIDPAGGTPPAPTGNYYTKSEIDVFLATLEPYTYTFTYSDVVGGNLVATHAKNTLYPFVVMQDSSGVVIAPPWTVTDANTVTVDMSAWGVFAGTYKISIRK